jgi:GT2 family glycosyltransferase
MSSNQVKLTIGIPTCAREQSVSACIDSIKKNVKIPFKLLVVDNTKAHTVPEINLAGKYEIDKYIEIEEPIGPSASRKIIAENTTTEYLLFLDDDNLVRKNSVETMMDYIEKNPEVSIVSGVWYEEGRYKFGQNFNFGIKNDKKIVFKTFITYEEVKNKGLSSVRFDSVFASMLCRTDIFKKVMFDKRYRWFYELYDFFMQCYKEKIIIESLSDVIFDHKPLKYSGKTMKHDKRRMEGKEIFIEKWGIIPIGELGQEFSLFNKLYSKIFSADG